MASEFSVEMNIGRVRFTSSVTLASNGSFYLFPFSDPRELRQFHLTVHGGIDEVLRNADPRTVQDHLRAIRRVIPYKIHARVGRLRLPQSAKDLRVEEMFGLWNDEEWSEEEFLLMSPEMLTNLGRVETRGSMLRVRVDVEEFFRLFLRSLRVVGGREVERAKDESALRRGGVFHPYMGLVMHPLVLRIGNEAASMGIRDNAAISQEFETIRVQMDALTGGFQAFDETDIQSVVMDALTENREVMGHLIRMASRMVRGLPLPPLKPIWTAPSPIG